MLPTARSVGRFSALEEQLGVSLFDKDGRGVKLTDAGLRLRDVSTGVLRTSE